MLIGARDIAAANADHAAAFQLDFEQGAIAQIAHALDDAACKIMTLWRVLCSSLNCVAFAGNMQQHFFRTDRNPYLRIVRAGYAVIHIDFADFGAIDDCPVPFIDGQFAFEYVHRADEIGNEAIGGIFVQIGRRRQLRYIALVNHRNAAGHRQCLILIVRHGDKSDSDLFL